jgi:hypothetical protein
LGGGGFGAETAFGALATGDATGAALPEEGCGAAWGTARSFGGSCDAVDSGAGAGAGAGNALKGIDPGVAISCRLRTARNPSQPVTSATARTATVKPNPRNVEDDSAALGAGTARDRAAGALAGAVTTAGFGAGFCGARDGAGRAGSGRAGEALFA